ncbi:hypothetical protein GE061_006607 [Apolygus lucorum]|uniref:Uncharacterized protein n=1 Tax=Apolygus lucorum TaxID=248454 RepID=A0A6A4JCA8_APOLU|nr:hypothetical protein GE061_006607 [Apolygus lucorum]
MHQIAAPFIFLIVLAKSVSAYVTLSQDGPGVIGSTIHFRAQVLDEHGAKMGSETLKFTWTDNAMPPHKFTESGTFSTSLWNVTYKAPDYPPGEYEVEVKVQKWVGFFYWDIGSQRITINYTVLLNGEMEIIQNHTILGGKYISQNKEVRHQIRLSEPDAKLLSGNDTIINSYWFLGCTYYGSTEDLTFPFNYTKDDLDHTVLMRALIVAGKETNVTIDENSFTGYVAENVSEHETTVNPDKNCEDFPIVPKDPNKYYGYFKRNVIPNAPVQVGNIAGATWLKMGEVLHLNLSCSGSGPFYHCVRFQVGEYNVTGNETCSQARPTTNCQISVTRYLGPKNPKYTVLFIISNAVSKIVTPVGVTQYSEKHHPQLSVIIVPISCSVLAIVLIIFGVAYWIQSRNRYKIEVADFDFSRNSDTEYKTFKERLRDAFSTAFTRVKEDSYSEEGPSHYSGGGGVWSPTRKNRPPPEGSLLHENSDSDQ